MTIGRFQPFTQGHLNMVNEGEGPCIVYRINSSNKTIERKKKGIKIGSKSWTDESVNNVIAYIDNPTCDLTEQEKELLKRPFTNELIDKELELVKKANKNIIDVIPVTHAYDALGRFNAYLTEHKDEYEPGYWMCGDDRVDSYSEMIDKYDELETEFKSGKNLPNICKGVLKTNIGKGRTKGVSGTAVRKAILNKDKVAFEKIMPKGAGAIFNDFIKAFDDFKIQLQNIIKEHKMMTLKEYITESTSLYDNGDYSGRNSIPSNYLEYNEGDKLFGELKKGDIVYLYSYSNDHILEITINGKLNTTGDFVTIRTQSFKINPNSKYCKSQSVIKFGPNGGGRSGEEGDYTPNNVAKSSICISYGGGWAVGTNKENVLKYAKSDISNSINKIQNDIEKLQNQIETLNKKLENIK